MKHDVHFAIDTDNLPQHTDQHIAQLWHIGQANPAAVGDKNAGLLADAVGSEIIVRWLRHVDPILSAHNIAAALGAECDALKTEQRAAVASSMADSFVLVPDTTLPGGLFVPAFRYAKYPASKGAAGELVLSSSAQPWIRVTHAEAREACAAAGFQLSTESQELAIRHHVAQQAVNWTKRKVGKGGIYQGLHKGSVSSAQPAGYVSDDTAERNWHELATGERVYGLAGNLWTWVFDDVQGNADGVIANKIAGDSISLTTAPFPSMEKGMGYRPDGERSWSGYALVRGGDWVDGDYAGVFALRSVSPGNRGGVVGFRCTKPA